MSSSLRRNTLRVRLLHEVVGIDVPAADDRREPPERPVELAERAEAFGAPAFFDPHPAAFVTRA